MFIFKAYNSLPNATILILYSSHGECLQQESIPVGCILPTCQSYVLQYPPCISADRRRGGGCPQVNKFEQVCSLQSLTGGGCLYSEVPCRGESLYMTENITLPQLCWQAVKMCLSVRHSAFTLCPINCPNNESGSTFNG